MMLVTALVATLNPLQCGMDNCDSAIADAMVGQWRCVATYDVTRDNGLITTLVDYWADGHWTATVTTLGYVEGVNFHTRSTSAGIWSIQDSELESAPTEYRDDIQVFNGSARPFDESHEVFAAEMASRPPVLSIIHHLSDQYAILESEIVTSHCTKIRPLQDG